MPFLSRIPRILNLLIMLAGVAGFSGSVHAEKIAETVKDGVPRYVKVNIIPEQDAVTPGEDLGIAIQQIHAPEWHTYWKNPGDSGESTSIEWTLPEGFKAGDIEYPAPHRLAYGPLMNYGFGEEVVLLTSLHVPEKLTTDEVTLSANISWLVCKDICVPEYTSVTLVLPVATADNPANPTNPEFFEQARAKIPQQKIWQGMIEEQDQTLKISFDPDAQNAEEL